MGISPGAAAGGVARAVTTREAVAESHKGTAMIFR